MLFRSHVEQNAQDILAVDAADALDIADIGLVRRDPFAARDRMRADQRHLEGGHAQARLGGLFRVEVAVGDDQWVGHELAVYLEGRDDVVDEASTRRGVDTVHSRFDARVAVLAGDFLFAQSSWHLANLDDLDVVKLLSRVIMDLADGEVKQGLYRFDTAQTFETYLEKSYCKTASLIANSARAAGVLSGLPEEQLDALYRFGRQLGLAFQVVDDILDFTGSDQQLGKPAASDLASGYLTAPVLYALEERPALAGLIEREFSESGDLDQALALVRGCQAIPRSRALAEQFSRDAYEALTWLPPSEASTALQGLSEFVLSRLY